MPAPYGERPHLLIVDDDQRIRTLLAKFLVSCGHLAVPAEDARTARALVERLEFDCAIVDIMMPGESGLDLARWLIATLGMPVVLLTARGEAEDRIGGLEMGAEDYITKPFEPRELQLRIERILNRARVGVREISQIGRWSWDRERGRLIDGAEQVQLTDVEARLLRALAARPDHPLARDDLIEAAGLSAHGRAVDVHITRLRRKLEVDPRMPRHLLTVRGEGYVLRPD